MLKSKPKQITRVIVCTSDYNILANIAIQSFFTSLAQHKNIVIAGVVSTSNFSFGTKSYRQTQHFIKKTGFFFFIKYIFLAVWHVLLLRLGRVFVPKKSREYFEISELCTQYNIPYIEVQNINEQKSENFIRQHRPDYLLSCQLLQIIKKNILNIPSKTSINFHPGLFDQHRGTWSAFWSLFYGFRRSGATIHYMSEKIDHGPVIITKSFRIKKKDTIYSINKKTAIIGGKLLAKSVIRLHKKIIRNKKLKKMAKIFSYPNSEAVKKFYQKGRSMIQWKEFWKG